MHCYIGSVQIELNNSLYTFSEDFAFSEDFSFEILIIVVPCIICNVSWLPLSA